MSKYIKSGYAIVHTTSEDEFNGKWVSLDWLEGQIKKAIEDHKTLFEKFLINGTDDVIQGLEVVLSILQRENHSK